MASLLKAAAASDALLGEVSEATAPLHIPHVLDALFPQVASLATVPAAAAATAHATAGVGSGGGGGEEAAMKDALRSAGELLQWWTAKREAADAAVRGVREELPALRRADLLALRSQSDTMAQVVDATQAATAAVQG